MSTCMKNLVRGRMGTDSTQVLRRIFECVRIFRRRAYEIERNSFIAVNKRNVRLMSRGDADAKTLPDVDRRNFSLVRLEVKSLRRSEREGSVISLSRSNRHKHFKNQKHSINRPQLNHVSNRSIADG